MGESQYLHVVAINKKGGMDFKENKGAFGRVSTEERERRNDVVIL